jgi:hypothetical protein
VNEHFSRPTTRPETSVVVQLDLAGRGAGCEGPVTSQQVPIGWVGSANAPVQYNGTLIFSFPSVVSGYSVAPVYRETTVRGQSNSPPRGA